MLKWTNSAQAPTARDYESGRKERDQTPHIKKRLRRRTTICQLNKENIVPITSTPFAPRIRHVHAVKTPSPTITHLKTRRCSMQFPKYAATLPRFEEEYSPSTILPSGQELALRGLLPDVFVGNQRYFRSPLLETSKPNSPVVKQDITKRKLEFELKEESLKIFEDSNKLTCKDSAKMTDKSLDKLIDAILESACKTQKRKKSRRSFNLRRRTLLRTHEEDSKEFSLSPSYAAGDDPASDLSMLMEPKQALPPTPLPHTPAYNHKLPNEILLGMPTPVTVTPLPTISNSLNSSTTTFQLETPVRPTRKRRIRDLQKTENYEKSNKKFRSSNSDYLEVGLALPSIYV